MASEALLDLIYAAPAAPELWADVLEACIGLGGAQSGWINELDRRDRSAGSGHVRGLDPCTQDRYFNYYGALDPFRDDAIGVAKALEMSSDERFIAKRDLIRGEFYSDFMAPIAVHSILILRMFDDGRFTRSMHLNYDKGSLWSDSPGWRELQALFPHLKRAAALGRTVQGLGLRNAALGRAIDVAGGGVFLLDADGRVCFTSEKGDALLREGSCLTQKMGRLLPVDHGATGSFEQLVDTATGRNRRFRVGESASLPVKDRDTPMIVTVTPLQRAVGGSDEAVAMVAVRQLEPESRATETSVASAFRLTPAEAKIALRLARGASPRRIAEDLDLSYHTVRNHLKQIYSKAEVNRQNDFVAKVLTRVPGDTAPTA